MWPYPSKRSWRFSRGENGAGLAFQGTNVSGRLGGEEEGKPRQSDAQRPGESDDPPKGRPNLKLVE